jgi:hypothetical protein
MLQRMRGLERSRTGDTFEGTFFWVLDVFVVAQLGCRCEVESTKLAVVRSLLVGLEMAEVIGLVGEGLLALLAFVGTFSGVSSLVEHSVPRNAELLFAVAAGKIEAILVTFLVMEEGRDELVRLSADL